MENSSAYLAAKYSQWDQFGTLTFKGTPPGRVRMLKLFFALMREMADKRGISFTCCVWLLRIEAGSLGRDHMHYLLGNIPGGNRRDLIWFADDKWASWTDAYAQIYAFDRSLNGPEYVTKCLTVSPSRGGEGRSPLQAQSYEVNRFGIADQEVEFSKSFWTWMRISGRRVAQMQSRFTLAVQSATDAGEDGGTDCVETAKKVGTELVGVGSRPAYWWERD